MTKQDTTTQKPKVFVAMSRLRQGFGGQAGGVRQKKVRVFVAMSGGVDSSVAAHLLKKQGYEVTGVYMKNWSEESMDGKFAKYCPWRADLADVKKVCKILKIPFKVYNFEKAYNRKVINYFFADEKRGLTPNPDIICNREIKFGLFLKKALAEGADFIATGHYVRIVSPSPAFQASSPARGEEKKKPYQLRQAKDKNKDQSYFLCLLNQKQLSKSLFPLGNLTKPEVRERARKAGLPTAEKPESMGICFVGEVRLEDFLKARIPANPGLMVAADGKTVGRHKGLAYYTIGQRKGLAIGGGIPYYVAAKDFKTNRLVVARGAENPELFSKKIRLNRINWIIPPKKLPRQFLARIRYRQKLQKATVKKIRGFFTVEFAKPQRAVAPGQFCALYENSVILGGGVIIGSYN